MIFILGYYLDSGNGAFDRLRYAFLIPLALGTVALPYTFSRASQLAFGLGATFLLLARLRLHLHCRRPLFDLGLASMVLLAALSVPMVTNRRTS